MNAQSPRDDVFIVAFTKDWGDVPTCTTHILIEMAKTIPVLWVASIGTRKPQASSMKDWRRLLGRLATAFSPAAAKVTNLRVLRPLLIPKAESRLSQWLNRQLFRLYLRREIPHSFSGTVEYWCFVPNAVDLIPQASVKDWPSRVIYYCADDWTKFHNLDGQWMQRKERELLMRSEIVFASSRYLVDKFSHFYGSIQGDTPDVVYMPHGVDYDAFSQALDKSRPLPVACRDIARPIIGFYGNLHAWVDFALIGRLASLRPDWSFVLIGEIYEDVRKLASRPNVIFLGRQEHNRLPDFCRAFDAAIIPYDLSHERMESVNPVKVKELLAAGVPIVASAIPELRQYGDAVLISQHDADWIDAIARQLKLTDRQRRLISEQVRNQDWKRKVLDIRQSLD
jgi:glycosyltransferase involved in cell wall biosynthesis